MPEMVVDIWQRYSPERVPYDPPPWFVKLTMAMCHTCDEVLARTGREANRWTLWGTADAWRTIGADLPLLARSLVYGHPLIIEEGPPPGGWGGGPGFHPGVLVLCGEAVERGGPGSVSVGDKELPMMAYELTIGGCCSTVEVGP